jgi:hypothetical protein
MLQNRSIRELLVVDSPHYFAERLLLMNTDTARARALPPALSPWTCVAVAVLFSLGLLAGSSAHAEIIVDQSFNANVSVISQDSVNSPDFNTHSFDDFTIGTAYNLTSLTVFGFSFYTDLNADIVGQIWSDLPGSFGGSSILSTSGTLVGEDLVFDFGGQFLPAHGLP